MAEINIALECFGSILTLILLGSLLLHGDRSNPSTRLFVGMLLVNLVSLWADAWAWYWNGTEYVVWTGWEIFCNICRDMCFSSSTVSISWSGPLFGQRVPGFGGVCPRCACWGLA